MRPRVIPSIPANVFQPSFKLEEKTRIGARVVKRYHPPVPPAARVLAHPKVAETDKERLRAIVERADPVLLFAGIRASAAMRSCNAVTWLAIVLSGVWAFLDTRS
ncbi:hypothetical protein [Mesorhizobium sp.]|uniref:hypothetical protein n=1 Tax=Mesorhizobium sp. TaxID=1871066 RepID=UPI00257E0D01|nr:hypothetical protein [Mesorhizobium sp.]